MEKPALADHPINDTMRRRWSPRAFTPRPMPRADILTLLEATRWAASSFNQQPWHFLVATRDDEERFAQLLDCLVPGNQVWARNASLLILTVTKRTFDHNDSPNSCAVHDIGLAACQLVLQATELGYATHQMAGIEAEKNPGDLWRAGGLRSRNGDRRRLCRGPGHPSRRPPRNGA